MLSTRFDDMFVYDVNETQISEFDWCEDVRN